MFKVLNITYSYNYNLSDDVSYAKQMLICSLFRGKSMLTLEKKVSSDWCLLVMACVLVSYQKSIKKNTGGMNEGVTHEYV